MKNLSDSELILYYLAVEKKYFDMLELYGLLCEFGDCPHCKKNTGFAYKVMREIVSSFGSGGKSGIRVPTSSELEKVAREITIWKGIKRIKDQDGNESQACDEYGKRFNLHADAVRNTYTRVDNAVGRFLTMKALIKHVKTKKNS